VSPWQLIPPLIDGEPVGSMILQESDEPTEPNAIVVSYYPDPERYVWDASTQAIMPISFAQSLERVKKRKRERLVRAADAAYKQEIPSFAGVVVAAKYGRGASLSGPEQAVFNKINAGYSRLNDLLAQVDAATTLEEVEQIQW
jgi:hypothetical protein